MSDIGSDIVTRARDQARDAKQAASRFISDIATTWMTWMTWMTTWMIFLPLVSRASGGGPRGSIVLLELKNGQLQVSE